MTWKQIKDFLEKMDEKSLNEPALVFDYDTDKFCEAIVCIDGKPDFHLTIN